MVFLNQNTVRRLCREIVIFTLFGLLLATIGNFLYMRHMGAQRLPPCPTPLTITADPPIQTPQAEIPLPRGYYCEDSFSHQQIFNVTDGPLPKPKIDNLKLALAAPLFGLYGFPIGIGAWLLYRLVYFAVKG
jgi:hypothetical protein